MFLLTSTLLLLLCNGGSSGGSGSGTRLAVVFLHANCQSYSIQDLLGLEEAAARVAAEDVSACFETPVDLTPIAAPPDATVISELDVLLEVIHPPIHSPAVQHIGVVYPGCSSWLGVMADILSSSVYHTPLLTYSFPFHPSHTSKKSYHTRIVPNEALLSPATVSVIREFGWGRVAVITENIPAFTELSNGLVSGLEAEGITVHHHQRLDTTQVLPDTPTLFSQDVKIFVLNMSPSLARAVLCQALHTLSFPGYVWITHGWFTEGWWLDGAGEDNSRTRHVCSGEQLVQYLEGSLAVSHHPRLREEEREGSGNGDKSQCLKSSSELATELLQQTMQSSPDSVSTSNSTPPPVPDSAYLVYDAVWTAAEAYFKDPQSNYPDIIDTVEFQGTSGPVSFYNGSRKVRNLTLVQYRMIGGHLENVPVADLMPTQGDFYDVIYSDGEYPMTVWPSGIPPDGTPIEVEHFPFPAVMGVVYTYSILGVLFALVCLGFNLAFRKKTLIKLTSPNLNNIIVLGAIISYLSSLTFFYPVGASRTGIAWGCNLRAWTVSLGYSLCYGTLNVKMWRVYAICRNPRPSMSKTLIKDYYLILLVLGLVMVDTVILTIVMSLDNSRFTVTTIPNKQDSSPHINEDGIKEVSVVSRCFSATEPYWLSVLFGYKAIIQASGLYLAFKIRNIKIRGLNDSREVSIILYISSVILLVIIIVTFVYGDYIDVDGFVYGFGFSTAVTVVLCLTFIPKMVSLYRDPEGKHIFKGPTSTDMVPPYTLDPSEVMFLQKRIKELEKQVELARSQENLLDITLTPCLRLSKEASPHTQPLSSPANNSSSSTASDSTTSGAQTP